MTIEREDMINLFESSNKFDEQFLRTVLQRKGIVLFLDGFDEISPNYDDVIVTIIKLLLDLSIKIYITTRPNRKKYLDLMFNELINIYEMNALSGNRYSNRVFIKSLDGKMEHG